MFFLPDIVECAMCAAKMEPKHWRAHAMIEHYNIAWVVGDNPIVSLHHHPLKIFLISSLTYSTNQMRKKTLYHFIFQEINNPYAVESYLKEYLLANNKLVCKVCKISRVSFAGFYAHIIVCGKSEEVS